MLAALEAPCAPAPPHFLIALAVLMPDLASAGCPTTYGTSCNNVCTLDGTSTIWTCDAQNATGPVTMIAVEDWAADSNYEAFGTVGGANFCCTVAAVTGGTAVELVRLHGSNYGDTLAFNYDALNYNLKRNSGSSMKFEGEIQGYGGNDAIQGSNATTNFTEYLYGGPGADSFNAHSGDDWLYGGAGADTMNAGAGDDYCEGGDNDDIISGGAGDDELYGGSGADAMSGGDGDDIMDGGLHNDTMCGDGNTAVGDYLDDGDADIGADKLWGAETDDTVECGNSSTQVDSLSTRVGTCSTLASRPTACP